MRKRYILILLALASLFGTLNAQCVQKVRVLEYKGEGPKTPLANVEVIVSNAGSVVTNKNGECQLEFRTLKPGDKISVRRIDKDGYELLKPEVLEQWFISRNADQEYVIVMTSSKRLKSVRDKFQRSAELAIQQSLQKEETLIGKQLNLGQISKEDYEKKLNKLHADYNDKLDNIDNYIDRMVHTDINDLSAEEKSVIDLVKKGKIAEALAKYEEFDLLGFYNKQLEDKRNLDEAKQKITSEIQKKEDLRNQLYESVKRQNDLMLLKGGEENAEMAHKLWRDFVYTDTTYYHGLADFALHCERANRLDEALDAVQYCRHSQDTLQRIRAELTRLQVMVKKQQFNYEIPDLEDAWMYMDSVSVVKKDSSMFLYERATALDLLCKSYAQFNDSSMVEVGRKYRDLAVATARRLYEWNKDFMPHKRKFVNTLYNAYYSVYNLDYKVGQNRYPEELIRHHYLDQAIVLQEELYGDDPAKNEAMLAFLYNARATRNKTLAFHKNDISGIDSIAAEYQKAITLYEDAYRRNPKAYAHYLAVAYANYGGLLSNAGVYTDKDKSIELLLKAKTYEEEAFEFNPQASRRTYFSMLWALGVAGYQFHDYEFALQYFDKAEDELLNGLYPKYSANYFNSMEAIHIYASKIYGANALNDSEKLAAVERHRKEVEAEYQLARKKRAEERANEDKAKVAEQLKQINKSKIIEF